MVGTNLGTEGMKMSKKDGVCPPRDYHVRGERNEQFSNIQ